MKVKIDYAQLDGFANALKLGKREAANIQIGDTFKGALPAAAKHYEAGTQEYALFVFGYMKVLEGYELRVFEDSNIVSGFTHKSNL